jgi:tyrosine-specific transport protein
MIKLLNRYQNSKMIGATLVVSGTAIGAAVLAQPLTSASIGYKNSLLLLLGMWFLMLIASYIQLALFKGKPETISFAKLAKLEIGVVGEIVASCVKMLLFYSLLAAYMTGGTSIILGFLSQINIHIPHALGVLIFTIIFGGIVSFSTRAVDHTNRIFLKILFLLFAALLFFLLPKTQTVFLCTSTTFDIKNWLIVVPIFFTSYGFHGSIPSLVSYLKNDQKQLRLSFFMGSIITLFVYTLWQTATLGTISCEQLATLSQDQLPVFFNQIGKLSPYPMLMPHLLNVFSFCAIVTSFLGVGLGQFNYVEELTENKIRTKSVTVKNRLNALLTFGVPFIFAVIYPKGFILALSVASAWLALLALILPGIMGIRSQNFDMKQKVLSFVCILSGLCLLCLEFYLLF